MARVLFRRIFVIASQDGMMKPTNRDGDPVDPVPFLVTGVLLLTAVISWGPAYLLGFDVTYRLAIGISAVVALGTVGISYHQLVWTVNPTTRQEVPVEVRIHKLAYAVVIGIIVTLTLTVVQMLYIV